MTPKISVVIPVFNQAALLKKALESLKRQTFKDFEIIVIDDCSKDNSSEVARAYTQKVFKNIENKGPARTRNIGISNSEGEIIAFTDSDCDVNEDWLEEIVKTFQNKDIQVSVGNTTIPPSGYIGDSISTLGHPGGGTMGFDKMWKVDKNGFATNISSCNLAIRKSTLEKYNGFDETFPLAAGEELELSQRYKNLGVKIKYNSKQKVNHIPRKSLKSFWQWQIYRGRGNYYIKKKFKDVHPFIKNKIWSSKNIIKKNICNNKLPMILILLSLSFVLQQIGYIIEKRKKHKN
ncbi:MAG TPA: glycosyltransferase [Nanoarchaeota archaeon]|nr:glycosyltransferase [Candidatus Woesearchaeota archaeon]HIH58999.1 glycosyltransferase [Nanoarchaeota archaeon]HII14387.1 glycosyltransferase [Nanoarchaeota archaeon]